MYSVKFGTLFYFLDKLCLPSEKSDILLLTRKVITINWKSPGPNSYLSNKDLDKTNVRSQFNSRNAISDSLIANVRHPVAFNKTTWTRRREKVLQLIYHTHTHQYVKWWLALVQCVSSQCACIWRIHITGWSWGKKRKQAPAVGCCSVKGNGWGSISETLMKLESFSAMRGSDDVGGDWQSCDCWACGQMTAHVLYWYCACFLFTMTSFSLPSNTFFSPTKCLLYMMHKTTFQMYFSLPCS